MYVGLAWFISSWPPGTCAENINGNTFNQYRKNPMPSGIDINYVFLLHTDKHTTMLRSN